jgi:hypothetical protein
MGSQTVHEYDCIAAELTAVTGGLETKPARSDIADSSSQRAAIKRGCEKLAPGDIGATEMKDKDSRAPA